MEKKVSGVVRIHDVKIGQDYMQWLGEIKARYHNAQIKAAVRVNTEQLHFNWQLGRDLVIRKAEERWGIGIVEQVSLDLQSAFPGTKGFSAANLWRMKQWYLFYSSYSEKLAQVVRELQSDDSQIKNKLSQVERSFKSYSGSLASDSAFPPIFAYVPWGHHIEIITKCKSIEEALFYILQCASEGWSRRTLMNSIKAGLYQTSGGAITNFREELPFPQGKLAQAITKDTYDFGFLSLNRDYEEEELERGLERQLTQFLLELGTGFAYLGRQKQLIVAGKARKLDMLFFHIPLNCYVVVELKAVPFQPEYVGKLNFYVNAVDDLIKTSTQNPTIGLLICSDKDETEVQYAFKGVQTPLGVSSYTNIQIKEMQDLLPSIEELKKRIRLHKEGSDR